MKEKTHREIAEENCILMTKVGSDLHGVSVNNQDDTDLMGVFIEPPRNVLGLTAIEHSVDRWHADGTPIRDGERSGPGDTDQTLYSLRKYVRLAAAGNPTVLMPFWAPKELTLVEDTYGEILRGSRQLFVTKQAGKKFLGYCNGQYAQMIDVKGKHTNRPELIEQFGFDTKFAYHALRLCIQGCELMLTGNVTLPMQDRHRDMIKRVRVGEFTKAEVTETLQELMGALEVSVQDFKGPERMDPYEIDTFLRNMYMLYWDQKGLL